MAVTITVLISSGGGLGFSWGLWALLPYFTVLLTAELARTRIVLVTGAIMSWLCAVGSLAFLLSAAAAAADALWALVFVFIPLYQLGFIVSALGLAAIVTKIRGSGDEKQSQHP